MEAYLCKPVPTPTWVPAPVLEIPDPLPGPSIYSDVPALPLTINGVPIRAQYIFDDELFPVAGHEADHTLLSYLRYNNVPILFMHATRRKASSDQPAIPRRYVHDHTYL